MSVLTLPSSQPTLADRARNASESANPSLWQGLEGAWAPQLGRTGGTLLDVSGHGNNGTLTNMDPATDWVIDGGVLSLDYDGTSNNNVLVTGANGFPNSTGAMTLYVNPDARSAACLCEVSDGTNNNRVVLYYPSSDQLTVYAKGGGSGANVWQKNSSTDVVIGEWNVVTLNWDTAADVYKVYINSVAMVPTSTGTAGDPSGMNQLNIGTYNDGVTNDYDGRNGSVLIHNHVLGLQEIRELHADPLAPFRKKPLHYTFAAATPAPSFKTFWLPSNRIIGY